LLVCCFVEKIKKKKISKSPVLFDLSAPVYRSILQ